MREQKRISGERTVGSPMRVQKGTIVPSSLGRPSTHSYKKPSGGGWGDEHSRVWGCGGAEPVDP